MKSLALLLILILIWAAGLFAFASRVAHSTPAQAPMRADGIVALTGPSALRMAAAMKLLEDGKGSRVLVSGVNRLVSRDEVRSVSKAPGRLFECCVDLGFSAADTIGNGRETAAWARVHRFSRLIVVTADYHMPRAVLELHGALPEAQIQPYPVATDELDAHRWWRSASGARRMTLEYCKYLVILTRESVLSLGPRARPPAPPPSDIEPAASGAAGRP